MKNYQKNPIYCTLLWSLKLLWTLHDLHELEISSNCNDFCYNFSEIARQSANQTADKCMKNKIFSVAVILHDVSVNYGCSLWLLKRDNVQIIWEINVLQTAQCIKIITLCMTYKCYVYQNYTAASNQINLWHFFQILKRYFNSSDCFYN